MNLKRVLVLLIAFSLCASISAAETKNFYFPHVRIDIQISPEGSFTVDEYRTYEFQGRFSWASLWIPLRVERQGYGYNVAVEDFSIKDENDAPLKTEIGGSGDRFEAKWSYTASNARRTFHIHFRVRGGVVSYPQVSELYWQAIGSGWDKPIREAEILVHLPEPVNETKDLLVYGHGPLSGYAEIIDAQTARFRATNLRAGQFLEIRVVWPSGMVRGAASDRHTRESIQEEEAQFVQETIAKANQAQESNVRTAKIVKKSFLAWLGWLFLGPLIWLFIFLRSWRKVGRDYRFADVPVYMREPPSKLQPALVEILMKEGVGITPRSFTATIFDLARRGYLEMEDRLVDKRNILGIRRQDYETTLTLKKDFSDDRNLLEHEKDLLDLIFGTIVNQELQKGARLTLDDMKKYFKRHPQTFQKWYQAWAKSIKEEGKKIGFIEPAGLRTRNIFAASTIPLAILTFNPILGVLAGVLIPKLKRRAMTWANEYEKWRAMDRFLNDFSNFKDIPPESYKLWEQYLVFGILFGNAKKIIQMLPIILKDERSAVPVWYYGFNQASFLNSGSLEHMISSINTMSTTIQQASTAAAHYSSGGGGGFSGGGGGGGGGGSAG
ncbi:MAG: DUF2207 domain-containing protein [Candidatus Aminicenantes bacterium]|nr:DUF2207 domain-containing protein [Candidatus Aminicenantes bacterium]